MHMLVGLAGATIAGYGGQQYGADLAAKELNDKCTKNPPLNKAAKETKAQRAKSCNAKYPVSQMTLHRVMMYAGCGLIVAIFVAMWLMNTNIFGGIVGGGGGGGYAGGYDRY
jgi:hypothetical protein